MTHIFGIYGVNTVTLRVTDNDLATGTTSHVVTCTTGWHSLVIDDNVNVNDKIGMCVTGDGASARACVAYQDYTSDDLRFNRALQADGSVWNSWINPVPTSDIDRAQPESGDEHDLGRADDRLRPAESVDLGG